MAHQAQHIGADPSAATTGRGDGGPWWRFIRRRPRPADADADADDGEEGRRGRSPPSADDAPKEGTTTTTTTPPPTGGWRGYRTLLRDNRNYRLYLCSHLCQHAGDWFVHVAGLIAIERMVPDSGTAISILVAMRMIPMILFTSFGGALADRFDRRRLMIVLDAWNASVALLYLLALHRSSPVLLYVVSFVRHSVVAMYEPVTRSIVPLLVRTDEELKLAMTMNGMAWAFTLAAGGTLAGWSAAALGVGACYVLDSATYVASTVVIWMVRGSFRVGGGGAHDEATPASCISPFSTRERDGGVLSRIRACIRTALCPLTSFIQMFLELMRYLFTCEFGALVFLKATGNITWGSADIINVHLAHVEGDELATSTHIGFLYSSVGLGCLLGPVAANFFTDMTRPATLQAVCIAALGFVVAGWLGMATDHQGMAWLCLFNSIRAFGSSIIWINSTLILQKLTSSNMLGRVLSFDFATTMLCDTVAAFVAGVHEDAGIATSGIALGAAVLVGGLWVFWSLYHVGGKGAARKRFNAGNALSPSVSLHKELEILGDAEGDLRLSESGTVEPITASLTTGVNTIV